MTRRTEIMLAREAKAPLATGRGHIQEGRDQISLVEYAFLIFFIVFPAMGTLVLPANYFAQSGAASPLGSFDIGKFTFYTSALAIGVLCVARYQSVAATALKAVPILVFFGWTFISCLWAPEPMASFNTTGRTFIIILGAIYIFSRMKSREIITILVRSFAISITISLICVIFFPSVGYNIELSGYESAWRGAMVQKNFLGGLMAYGVFIGYYANLYKSNSILVRHYVLIGSIFMTAMSQSATAMISVTVTWAFLVLLAFINNGKSTFEKLMAIWLFSATMTVILIAVIFSDELFQLIGRSANLTGRSQIWPLVWELIEDRPMYGYGHGFWTAQTPVKLGLWARGGWVIAHAHNAYLDIWFQTGFIGFILSLIFILKGVARPIKLAIRNVPPVGFFWGSIFFVTFAKSFTETQWLDPNSTTMFWTTLSYIGLSSLVTAGRSPPSSKFSTS